MENVGCWGAKDWYEVSLDAITDVINELDWRPESHKVVFLVTDAPFHERGESAFSDVIPEELLDLLISTGTICLMVVPDVSRVPEYHYDWFVTLAGSSGGAWLNIEEGIHTALSQTFSMVKSFLFNYEISYESHRRVRDGSTREVLVNLVYEEDTATAIDSYLAPGTGIEGDIELPVKFIVSCYPNPFNSSCRIEVPGGSQIQIYDITGRIVFEFPSFLQASIHSTIQFEFVWIPDLNLSSGIYFIKASLKEGLTVSRKIIYFK